MKPSDMCFYMNITKEENSAFILAHPNQEKETGSIKRKESRDPNYSKVASMIANVGRYFLVVNDADLQSAIIC